MFILVSCVFLWYFPEVHSFSDIALIQNNARVGSQIACALPKHKEKRGGNFRGDIKTRKSEDQRIDSKPVSGTVQKKRLKCFVLLTKTN